jgi:demethylmenaquinone methyltransferase/2-methoxy-6-polyprenyl-1,4-benzoquinol methylase
MIEENALAEDREYIKTFFRENAGIYDLASSPSSACGGRPPGWSKRATVTNLLDVATGTGKQAFAFARRGFQVTGIDISEDMLRIARRKNRFPNLKLETGDATSLPLRQ